MKTEILITQEEKEDIIAKSVARAIYDFYGGENYVTVNGKLIKAAAYAVEYAQQAIMDKLADEVPAAIDKQLDELADMIANCVPAGEPEKAENEAKTEEKPANKDKKIKSIILDGKKYEVVDNGSFRKITINGVDYLVDGYFLQSVD